MKKFLLIMMIISTANGANCDACEKEVMFLRSIALDFKRLQPLIVDEKYISNYDEIFNTDYIRQAKPQTDDQLYTLIENHYYKYKDALSKAWNVSNDQLLHSLFLMNTTSALWAFGNKVKVTEVGCAFKNENLPKPIFDINDPISLHIPEYINSKIACCTDFTRMLSMLLNKAMLQNRIIINPGHMFNEVLIDNTWQALDATTNFWWHDSWEHIQNSKLDTPIIVSVFPNYGTQVNHEYFRKFIGQFRNFMQLEGIYKIAKDIKYVNGW